MEAPCRPYHLLALVLAEQEKNLHLRRRHRYSDLRLPVDAATVLKWDIQTAVFRPAGQRTEKARHRHRHQGQRGKISASQGAVDMAPEKAPSGACGGAVAALAAVADAAAAAGGRDVVE